MTTRTFCMFLFAFLFATTVWITGQTVATPLAVHAQDEFSCDAVSEIPLIECEALVAIRSTNPDAYIVFYPDDWLQTLTPCSWQGITCEGGYITGLRLNNIDYPFSEGLTSVPPEIGNLTHLTSLHIHGSELTTLPSEIGDLADLTELNLASNKLTSLPPEIDNLANLTSLNLADNKLTSLPPEIFNLTNLTSLSLSYNQLTSLSPEIGNLVNLESLNLSYSELTSVPAEIATLANLTSLELNDNEFTSVPAEFSNLGAEILAQLANSGIRIEGVSLDCASVSQITQAECEALVAIRDANPETFFTGGWAITETPCSWTNVTCSEGHVSELTLHFEIITNLPPEIGNLTHLTLLDLDRYPGVWICRVDFCTPPNYNRITTLPPEIGNITSLVTLDLGGNQLTSLPPEIGNLINLQTVDLNRNQLTTLPPEFGNLVNLTSLNIASNPLESLPPEMYNIPSLEDFDIDLSLIGNGGAATTPDGTPSTGEGIFLPFVTR